jgi:hypothetical protein
MKTHISRITARVLVTALLAGVVAAAVGGVSLARAGSSHRARTITLTEVQTGATFVNISHTQNGAPGDQAIFRSNLKVAGRKVGHSSVVCEIVLGGSLQCNGIYHLPGGTLTGTATVSASESSTAPVHIAVTGGTGRYAHASGQGISTPESPTVSRTVISLG